MTDKNQPGLGEVLESFMAEVTQPDRETLERYVAAYPQYAEELAEFASEWIILDAIPDAHMKEANADDRAAAMGVMEKLVVHMREVEAKGEEAGKATGLANPFANQAPQKLKTIAVRLGLDTPLMAKLKNRLILVETIPKRLLASLAVELEVAAETISQWLSAPPRLQGARFKADGKPQVSKQESFSEAVDRSTLSDDQKRQWKT